MSESFHAIPPPEEEVERHKKASCGTAKNRYFDDIIPMGEFEVREALIAEAKRHRLWKTAAITRMNFDQLEMQNCLQYTLESYTECRSTCSGSESVSLGAYLEQDGMRGLAVYNNPWDYEVEPDHMFVDQVRVLEMPGTSTLNACTVCNSDGTVHCFHCRGQGTDKCNFCRGTGMKAGVAHPAVYTHPMIATFPHADLSRGYASSSTAMMKQGPGGTAYGVGTPMHFMSKTGVPPPGIGTHDLCYMCHGRGVKECYHCKGGGKKPCTTCNGSGNVRNFTRLKVYFKVEKLEHFTSCDVPARLLRETSGKNIFEEEQPYVLPITKYPLSEINEQSRMFCAKHVQDCMGRARVIRQRHTLIAIPVCKVHFSLGNTKGVFYVYGNEKRCFVPKFPSKCTIL